MSWAEQQLDYDPCTSLGGNVHAILMQLHTVYYKMSGCFVYHMCKTQPPTHVGCDLILESRTYRDDPVAGRREVQQLSEEDVCRPADGGQADKGTPHVARSGIVERPGLVGLVYYHLGGSEEEGDNIKMVWLLQDTILECP